MAGKDTQRIDKWLWFARLAKTRTLAQKLAVSGKVRVNREKNDSASRSVRPGDTLTIATDHGVLVLRIRAPGTRRGPALEARLLYEDLSPPPVAALAGPREPSAPPTKRDRRRIHRFTRANGEDVSRGGGSP